MSHLIDRGSYYMYVGCADSQIHRPTQNHLDAPNEYQSFQTLMTAGARSFYFPRQTHSTSGHVIATADVPRSFVTEGDYVITNVPGVAVGVLTADCLPVLLYDPHAHACAIVHAGWRGVAAQIVITAVEHMAAEYQSHPDALHCYIGPSARVCCYEVDQEFEKQFAHYTACIRHDGKILCDLVAVVQQQLAAVGVVSARTVVDPVCTIDDHRYYSHRRQGQNAGRQMTLVCLR